MTKKDFILIAKVLKEARDKNIPAGEIAVLFVGVLGATCPRFDRERFLTACGV